MKRYVSVVCLSLAAMVLLTLVVPALAGEDLPFEFIRESGQRLSEQGNSWVAVGTGRATHMGDVTFVVEVTKHGDRYGC